MDGVKIEWIGVETDAGRNLLSYASWLRKCKVEIICSGHYADRTGIGRLQAEILSSFPSYSRL